MTTCDYDLDLSSGEDSPNNDFGDFERVDISGTKVIDDEADGSIAGDTCDGGIGCAGVTVNLDGTDNMGGTVDEDTTTDANGDYEFLDIKPGVYTITIDDPIGFECSFPMTTCDYDLDLSSGEDSPNNDFGDFARVDIHAHKFFDFNENMIQDGVEQDLAGVTICLTGTDGMGVDITEDCQVTDDDGLAWWMDLKPGTYQLEEDLTSLGGLFPTIPVDPDGIYSNIVLVSGDTPGIFEFGNVGDCNGLTPGFWKNWRNHFDTDEMNAILAISPTIAADIDAVDEIFAHWDASDPSDLTILKAFTLANQLTLNLTQWDPNNLFGSIFNACLLEGMEGDGTLGEALAAAVGIIVDGDSATDAEILALKDILDAFANQSTS